ncbi:MAG: ORF6N domain-containing protein [Bacilli bacterium]
MNEIIVQDNIKIEDLIYEVRGKQVMLAHDLATLYGVTSGNLNKARNRNIERFPEDFCFRLTKKEYQSWM